MADEARERDARYRKGYLEGYRLALINIEGRASVETLRKFVADELEPWAKDTSPDGRFVPAPTLSVKYVIP